MKLRIGRGVFAPRLWPSLITLICLPILLGLGTWQIERLHWKQRLLASIVERSRDAPVELPLSDTLDADYRPAHAVGQFHHDKQFFIFATNAANGKGGYHVLTPLELADGHSVLVDRGWIPYERKAGDFARPEGTVDIRGILKLPQKQGWFSAANNPAKGEWYGVDLAAMAKADGMTGFPPYVLEAAPAEEKGVYPMGGQTRLTLPNDHFGYAVTWYSFAAILLIIFGLSSYRSDSRASASKE